MGKVASPFGVQKWSVKENENPKVRKSLTMRAKVSLGIAIVLVILVITVVLVFVLVETGKKLYWMPDYHSASVLGRFAKAAVSTDAAPCAEIGREILEKGGSAVDAAIAVLLCMGVVNPQSSGLGGGFLMVYYNRTEKTSYYINAREVSPRSASEDMYGGNETLSRLGPLSIAVPGELAGFSLVHRRFGHLPWRDLFPPTVRMCREGIRVNKHLSNALIKYEKDIREFEGVRKIFVNNETSELLKEFDIYTRPELAATLEIIAKENSNALYGNTPMAVRFFKDLQNARSLIDKEDLQNYEARELRPIRVPLRGNVTLHSASLPGSGELLAMMLQVLEGYQDMDETVGKTREGTVRALQRMVETFKFAYARRMELEDDDSEEMNQIVQKLTSKIYAGKIRDQIDDRRTYSNASHYGLDASSKDDHGTAHVSIVAPNGDAVAATSTINQYFGSMIVSPSTGIILNDEMDDFSSSTINYFGIPPSPKNHIRPGKRPLSSMTPTVITDDVTGDVRMVIGGNGGTQITTSCAQVIIRNLWMKEDIKKCIDAPRFHHQLLPMWIENEKNFPKDILSDLQRLGHETKDLGEKMLGIVMGIARGEDGYLYANSDYRKEGTVDGF